MALKLKDAVAKAEKTDDIRKLRSSGFFLNSAISILQPDAEEVTEWILTYYNLKQNKVVEVVVNDALEFKEAARPIKPTKEELLLSQVKTSDSNMLEKARKEFLKFREPLSQVILSLQVDGKPMWSANFITKTLFIVTVKIDAGSGTLLGSEKNPLTRTITQAEPGT
jgi:hypothetical protein